MYLVKRKGETHFVSSDRKKQRVLKLFVLLWGWGFFACLFCGWVFSSYIPILHYLPGQDWRNLHTKEYAYQCGLSRFYFFHTSCICSDPDMHSSFSASRIQRQRPSFYLLAMTYQFSNASCSLPSMAMESI